MKASNSILIAFVIIFILNIIGTILPPFGIMATPWTIIGVTFLIGVTTTNSSPLFKSISIVSLACFNDILTKLFAGGHHDSEGQGWITLMFLIGVIVSYLIMIIVTLTLKTVSKRNKITTIIYYPTAILIHLSLFGNLGID